jgi:hypothetical protein
MQPSKSKTGSLYLDLKKMDNSESIVVTKKFDEVASSENPSKFEKGKTWTSYYTKVEFEGQEVYLNFKGGYGANGYVQPTDVVEAFNALGPAGTIVKITMTKGMGKDVKGEDVVTTDLKFEAVVQQ